MTDRYSLKWPVSLFYPLNLFSSGTSSQNLLEMFDFDTAFLSFIIISSCKSKENKISASRVPQSTMAAFNTKYPGAKDVAWITEKRNDETIYEAAFNLNGKKLKLNLMPTAILFRKIKFDFEDTSWDAA